MRKTIMKKQTIENEVVTNIFCDVCKKEIEPCDSRTHYCGQEFKIYHYLRITTHHIDWRNGSVDSYERFDACCPECAMKFAKEYVENAYESGEKRHNSRVIEIENQYKNIFTDDQKED